MYKYTLFSLLLLYAPMQADEVKTTTFQSVPQLNVDKFLGTWYLIARLEFPWDRGCFHNPVATFSKGSDGSLKMATQCQTNSFFKSIQKAEGSIEMLDSSHSKWKITYPRGGKYKGLPEGDIWWIVLAEDYSHAAASDPEQDHLWIYSRTPHSSREIYQSILDKVVMMMPDINVLNILPTKQD
ncbi:MAG: lipocalin family protein [Parachlamydia sp.]|jgi:apolipoprotein D and lipocalin family protein|nr:lipocalin family protein [Parachlamydia sp.]